MDEKRDERFTFMCDDQDLELLGKLAEQMQRTRSDTIRFLLRKASAPEVGELENVKNEIVLHSTVINEAQRAILEQKTPKDAIKTRPGPKNKIVSYVEHAWVTEQLNLAFEWNWSWEVTETHLIPNAENTKEVCILGRLTIQSPRGELVKMQYGSAKMKSDSTVGARLKAASSDGLKKASSLLGLALDLYSSSAPGPSSNGDDQREENGVLSRPLKPDALRSSLEMKARGIHADRQASEEQMGLVMGMLNACFAGDSDSEAKRKGVLRFLFGIESGKDLSSPRVLSLLDWLKPTRDSGGAYVPDSMAAREAALIILEK